MRSPTPSTPAERPSPPWMSSTRSSAKAAPCTVSAAKSLPPKRKRDSNKPNKKKQKKSTGTYQVPVGKPHMVFIQHHHYKDFATLSHVNPAPPRRRLVRAATPDREVQLCNRLHYLPIHLPSTTCGQPPRRLTFCTAQLARRHRATIADDANRGDS